MAHITEDEYHALIARRLPRYEIDTSAYRRHHFCDPPDGKVAIYSFEYEDIIVTLRADYRRAAGLAIKLLNDEFNGTVAVQYVRLLARPHKHGDHDQCLTLR